MRIVELILKCILHCIWKNVNKQMLCRPDTAMDTLSLYLEHRKEMSSNDDSVIPVCHNVLSQCFYTVYVGSCCGSPHLWLYNLLVKMFGQDYVYYNFMLMKCSFNHFSTNLVPVVNIHSFTAAELLFFPLCRTWFKCSFNSVDGDIIFFTWNRGENMTFEN